MILAPVILFVYNRPWHTEQTLRALQKSKWSSQTILYVYCDGYKPNATNEDRESINKVRALIKEEQWCKEVCIVEREGNLGLANSIISGVNEVFEKHDSAIVLEDDILIGHHFLEFLNEGLSIYKEDKKVYGVSGYTFPTLSGNIKDSTFFLPIMSSWGYGVWRDRWEKVNFDDKQLLNIVEEKKIGEKLDFAHLKYYQMLKDKVNGKNDSWAIRFYVSMFLDQGVFLYPQNSLLQNIGFDGSGVHCGLNESFQIEFPEEAHANIMLEKCDPILKEKILKLYEPKVLKKKTSVIKKLKKLVPKTIKKIIKNKISNISNTKESLALNDIPRYQETKVTLSGKEIIIPDYASFRFMYKEIYEEEIYKFQIANEKPFIIDGGANIGLASLYLKKIYPKAEIVAFEPDPDIYKYLIDNIKVFGLSDVNAINKGIWEKETTLHFTSEGADAGLVTDVNSFDKPNKSIKVVSLKKYLDRKVDFLKLDIEGSETIVLKDIKDKLHNVDRIFVEYHSFVNMTQTLNEIINILTESGFRIYINAPGIASKAPFTYIKKYNNMDLQLNIFGIKSHLL